MMTDQLNFPQPGRDLRLDLFRGLANWVIFLDHIPNNMLAWITTRNYGFSDAADLFVFISGFSAPVAYSAVIRIQGFVAGAAQLLARVRQLYIAHVMLFIVYVVAIGWVAQTYSHSHLLDKFNVATLIAAPIPTLTAGLLLAFKPLNLDVLPLYVVLMAAFAPMLWLLLRFPLCALAGSAVAYVAAPVLALEFSCVSLRGLVLQSDGMAISVHSGRVVRLERKDHDRRCDKVAHCPGRCRSLTGLRLAYDRRCAPPDRR